MLWSIHIATLYILMQYQSHCTHIHKCYIQVYYYNGSMRCFHSAHLAASIVALLLGVVVVLLFPVLILVISFRTYKVDKMNVRSPCMQCSCHALLTDQFCHGHAQRCTVHPTIHRCLDKGHQGVLSMVEWVWSSPSTPLHHCGVFLQLCPAQLHTGNQIHGHVCHTLTCVTLAGSLAHRLPY